MKRTICFLSALLLLLSICGYASSSVFDYNTFKKTLLEEGMYEIEENTASKNAFVYTDIFSVAERSFEHDNSSNDYYSYFDNDWIITDYESNDPTPIRRLWIYYSSIEAINAESVTFTFAGNDYTFFNIFEPADDLTKYENGDSLQEILIKFGSCNEQFLYDIYDYAISHGAETYEDILDIPKVKVTFHGDKDVTTEFPNSFIIDILSTDSIPLGDLSFSDVLEMSEYPTGMNITSVSEDEDTSTLILGREGEFAISTNGIYTYNTPNSSLPGYDTTDEWLFEHDENIVCVVHSNTCTAYISYHSTENNVNIPFSKLLGRCLDAAFSEYAPFYDGQISLKFDMPQIIITSSDEVGSGGVNYAYTFVVLERGIVEIASNGSSDDELQDFVAEIADNILAKDDNYFVELYTR